jgi:uncharacterized protein (TIGR02722 family)
VIKILLLVLLGFAVTIFSSCSTKITRVGQDSSYDLSGNWNDTDSRLVSQEMVQDLLARPWYMRFKTKLNKQPVVVVGKVGNLSSEHIDTGTFVSDIERELINSGKVDFVAGSDFRNQIRNEKKDQDLNSTMETRKELGQEIGADFILVGTIRTIIDSRGNEQVRFYQTNLKLINIKTNRIIWTGQKKIKKLIQEGSFR